MNESQKFEYNAPTYVDFLNGIDDSNDVDNFFDLTTSQKVEQSSDENKTSPSELEVSEIKQEICCTPEKCRDSVDNTQNYIEQENLTPNVPVSCKTPNSQNGRRSRILFEALEGLGITTSAKTHKMITRKDPRTPLLELRGRSVPRNVNFLYDYNKASSKVCREIIFEAETDHLTKQIENLSIEKNDNAHQNDEVHSNVHAALNETVTVENSSIVINECNEKKRKSHIIDSPSMSRMHENKYISLEQSALNFKAGFRSKISSNNCHQIDPKSIKHLTIPKTPNLLTKTRSRPNHFLSRSEEENELLKELRAKHPKANPVPKGLFNPPKLGIRRSAVPKYTFGNFKVPSSTTTEKNPWNHCVKPVRYSASENCVKVIETDQTGLVVTNKQLGHRGVGHRSKQKIVTPQPFSFHERDQENLRRKQEKIRMIIEEEKKLHEVHANPLPRYIRNARHRFTGSQASLNSTTSTHSTCCSSFAQNENHVFTAKSPTVLHQRPFIPRKSMKPCSQIEDFKLHTEERSQQREQYESQKRQRELEKQLNLQEREKELKRLEDEAYRAARKSTVHKPLPLPKNRPLLVQNQNISLESKTL